MKLIPGQLTLAQLADIAAGRAALQLDDWTAVDRSAARVAAAAAGDAPVYGVNTGFGKLASTRIAKDQLAALQLNLIRSHAVGVGAPMSPEVVRLMLATKAGSLARGFSGVRRVVVQSLLDALAAGFVPYVPCQGSVGASGDLAPLAHLTLALMGEGEALVAGRRVPAREELARLELQPLTLAAKEGLALINGTQASTALALHALLRFEGLFATALASSTPASTRCAASRGKWKSPPSTASCSPAARSARRTAKATSACRTRTACAASRRSWAPAWTRRGMRPSCWCARRTR
jgi:histidine ammonia-lyase